MQNAGRSWANWVNVEHFHLKSAFVINRFLGVSYSGPSNWPYLTFRCDLSTDPKQRLALFRRLEETNVTRKPVSQPSRQTLPRKEYFQGKKHIPTNTVIWTIRSCYHKVLCRVCNHVLYKPQNPKNAGKKMQFLCVIRTQKMKKFSVNIFEVIDVPTLIMYSMHLKVIFLILFTSSFISKYYTCQTANQSYSFQIRK